MEVYIKIEPENIKIIRNILIHKLNSIVLLALREFDTTKNIFPQETIVESKLIYSDSDDIKITAKLNQVDHTMNIEIKNIKLIVKFIQGISSNISIQNAYIRLNIRKEEFTITFEKIVYLFSILEKPIQSTETLIEKQRIQISQYQEYKESQVLKQLIDFSKKFIVSN